MEDGTTYPTHQIKLPLTSWSTFQVTVTFDHAYTARCIVLLKNKPTPTLTQIFAGNDGQNQPAVVAGVQSTANARLGSAPAAGPGEVLASVHRLEGQDVPSGGRNAGEQPERSRWAAVSRSSCPHAAASTADHGG